jgi:hypothetical protein
VDLRDRVGRPRPLVTATVGLDEVGAVLAGERPAEPPTSLAALSGGVFPTKARCALAENLPAARGLCGGATEVNLNQPID